MQHSGLPLRMTVEERVRRSRAALVIIDVQNDFCAAGGFVDQAGQDVRKAQSIIGNLRTLVDEARRVGVQLIFVQAIYDLRYLSPAMIVRHHEKSLPSEVCNRGTWGAEFYEIFPNPGEEIVQKHRYSAFQGTNLDMVLRSRGVETVLLTGVNTNVCVESTARDGYFLNYYVGLVKDCTACPFDDLYESTLKNIEMYFGDLITSHQLIEIWKQQV